MPGKVQPIPTGHHTVTPNLVVREAAQAIDFYVRAFGAKELGRMSAPDGKIVHAELKIGDSIVMLADEFPFGNMKSPQTFGGSPVSLFLYVPDVDAAFEQAVAAGAKVEMPPADMFWGDRFCSLADPFGHQWSIATHVEDVSPAEMTRRFQEAMGEIASGKPGCPGSWSFRGSK